ncbi:inner centromere protein [Puma concolor]|uniref:Inner centromere protein n=1 Tax=Puma concolor TaxID=9696 RepID=A0A6P6H6S7_PUMCO|nr:inner centromere protein [Puma concolor]
MDQGLCLLLHLITSMEMAVGCGVLGERGWVLGSGGPGLSRRRTRSSQLSSRHLRSKDKVEKLATVVGENGSVLRRVTRAAAAAAAAATIALAAPSPTPESPTVLAKEPENSLAQGPLVPVVEIGVSERQSAELHLGRLKSARAPSPTPSLVATAPASHSILISGEESTPQKPEAGRLASVTVSSLMATPQDPKGRGGGASRSASKLRIAQASPGPQDLAGSPASPWQERVLAPILPDNCSTPTGAHIDPQSVRRSLIAPSSPGRQVSLAQKYSLVAKQEKPVRRSSRRIGKKATEEPAASARIICESGGPTGGHSYLERLLNIEVPQKVGPQTLQGAPGSGCCPLVPGGALLPPSNLYCQNSSQDPMALGGGAKSLLGRTPARLPSLPMVDALSVRDEEERRHQELLQKKREEEQERLRRAAEAKRLAEQQEHERRKEQERLQAERELQEKEKALRRERELEEKKKKVKGSGPGAPAGSAASSGPAWWLPVREQPCLPSRADSHVYLLQSPACTSYQMTPQGHRPPPKINPDNYGMDLNSDDSTDDEAHPRKPIPTWARGSVLSVTLSGEQSWYDIIQVSLQRGEQDGPPLPVPVTLPATFRPFELVLSPTPEQREVFFRTAECKNPEMAPVACGELA